LQQSLKINHRFSLKVTVIGNNVSSQFTWNHCFIGQLLTANTHRRLGICSSPVQWNPYSK